MSSRKNLALAIAMILVVISVFGTYTALSVINNAPLYPATPQGSGYIGLYIAHPLGSGQVGVNILSPDSKST